MSMEDFLRDHGLQEYYPRFMAQGIDEVEDVRRERRLDALLDSVGMTANPGHIKKFKEALSGAGSGGGGGQKRKAEDDGPPPDPMAEAIKASLAASKARGGGGGAWKDATATRLTVAGRVGLGGNGDAVVGASNARITLATEEEVHEILRNFRTKDYLRLLGLPGAPVDKFGKVEWQTHVVMSSGEIALKSKVLSLRLEPSRHPSPLAAEAYAAVIEAHKTLSDKEGRKAILTLAVQRRVDEMRRKGEGDVQGGYVSMTGVHYAAGAAASQIANFKGDEDGAHGPTQNPGAFIKPPTSALEAMAAGADDAAAMAAAAASRSKLTQPASGGGGDDEDDEDDGAMKKPKPPGGGGPAAAPKMDLGSIRDKLKKKKPNFM